jgi:glycosyltransferase involved in cell wall biosynthesis
MAHRQIIGVVLVRNEDLHVRQAVENIAHFCDRILLADHGSTDGTPEILRQLATAHSHVSSHRIASPRESHDLIAGFAGTDTWVFGVDGDELYDPAGLARLRPRLFAGEFDDWWMVFGNVLNCDAVDPVRKTAAGWLAPPCRSITKLYNFRIIESWTGDTPERLHGGRIVFHPGHDASARLDLHEQIPWADSPLRCLHTCFVARSSADAAAPLVRENIMDVHAGGILRKLRRGWKIARGMPLESGWKKSRYRRGEHVTIDAGAFFP